PDVTLCLEVADVSAIARASKARGGKTINVSAMDLFMKSNIQDFQHYAGDLDLDMGADAEATLPALIEACKKLITADRKRTLDDRGKKLAAASEQGLQRARTEATYAWDASPVSTGRVWAEMWDAVRTKDFSVVSGNPP